MNLAEKLVMRPIGALVPTARAPSFPEDGRLRVYGVGEDGVTAFTQDGIENLRQVIADERAVDRAPATGQTRRIARPCGAHRSSASIRTGILPCSAGRQRQPAHFSAPAYATARRTSSCATSAVPAHGSSLSHPSTWRGSRVVANSNKADSRFDCPDSPFRWQCGAAPPTQRAADRVRGR